MLIGPIDHAGGHRNNPDSNANDLGCYANEYLARQDAMKLSGFIILHPAPPLQHRLICPNANPKSLYRERSVHNFETV